VGASAGALAFARKRWPLLLSPLYTRLAKARILEQPTRERIAETVKAEPGITFGELQRRLGLAAGQLTHHARKLEEAGVLYSSPDGQARRFFHVGQGRVEAVPPLRDRALEMLSRRAMTLSELATELGVTKQALHYHVKKLEEAGVVAASPQGELVLVLRA
jgi:DNA-binding transcriptional ArsR family regulator